MHSLNSIVGGGLHYVSNGTFWIVSFNSVLANVNTRSRSHSITRPSVCLSVTLVRCTQAVEIFGNISTAFGTLAIRWHPQKLLRRSSQGHWHVWHCTGV